jgi:lysophospholipase L1-like esterase
MAPPLPYRRYIALGDSMSIGLYPALDLAGVETVRDRSELKRGLGAASLLYRNDDALWPEFARRDLASVAPHLEFRDEHDLSAPIARARSDLLAADGATTSHVLSHQLPEVKPATDPTLVTLTAGGNDLLELLGSGASATEEAVDDRVVEPIARRARRIIERTLEKLPNATILVSTVYDPTDGSNDLGWGRLDREAGWLTAYNDALRAIVAEFGSTRLADIHRHFLGHGLSVPDSERWYWSKLIIEPNLRGASEIRRVWLETLGV